MNQINRNVVIIIRIHSNVSGTPGMVCMVLLFFSNVPVHPAVFKIGTGRDDRKNCRLPKLQHLGLLAALLYGPRGVEVCSRVYRSVPVIICCKAS